MADDPVTGDDPNVAVAPHPGGSPPFGPERIRAELARAAEAAGAPAGFEPGLERPADPAHGDFASNAALVLAGRLRTRPRELAERIAAELDMEAAGVASVDIAGPGFLNFRLSEQATWRGLAHILAADRAWGPAPVERPRRVNVEFVSTNPTGPLHVAHGRGAAMGDAIASLLAAVGNDVAREFYVNDAGGQIQRLGESIDARFQQSLGADAELPEGGYHGEYVGEIAARLAAERGTDELASMDAGARVAWFAARGKELLREEHERDLLEFGVRMDRWVAESSFAPESGDPGAGPVGRVLERLEAAGHVYREGGALWLRTTAFGDDKDRVLIKSDGSHTYFLTDIAYHLDKAARGFEHAIDVWGADHQSHVHRMRAAMEASGCPEDFLELIIIQLVSVLRGGVEVKMSKRAGSFVPLRELFEETGTDVARYFFLMRRAETPMTFDLDLALDTSDANPVYKVQYAHARLHSIFEKGDVEPDAISVSADELARLGSGSEREVAKVLLRYPEIVAAAADGRAPHLVCTYLEEVASTVNAWYHEGNLEPERRVLAAGPTRPGRLALARAAQITLRNGLELLGLTAPERMERR